MEEWFLSELDSIRLDRLTVSPGRMRLEVSLSCWTPQVTDARIAKEAIAKYPTICSHSCINSAGPSFGDVIEKTSVPHLLEHMIIEEQLSQRVNPTAVGSGTLVGTTRMSEDGNHAVVEVSFFDDLVAVGAIGRALEELNSILPCRPYLY